MGTGISKIIQQIMQGAKFAFVLSLVVLVSGLLPVMVQGYAWLDMAKKAGGIHTIAEVVTKAEPCKICCAAQDMRENSSDGDGAPVPTERLELLKTLVMDKSSSDFPGQPTGSEETRKWLRLLKVECPSSCAFSPATPPPRVIAA